MVCCRLGPDAAGVIRDLRKIPVKENDIRPVLLEDVARVVEGAQVKRGDAALNGEPAVMLNILGDAWFVGGDGSTPVEPDWIKVVRHPRAKLHLYGKREPRRGRKMGHVTVLGDSLEMALGLVQRIEADLGIGPS